MMEHLDTDTQICSAQYAAGSIEVKAVLFIKRSGVGVEYGIILEQAGERAVCCLGSDQALAKRIFFAVVFGGVTACTLSDVVEDYRGTIF